MTYLKSLGLGLLFTMAFFLILAALYGVYMMILEFIEDSTFRMCALIIALSTLAVGTFIFFASN